MVAIEEPTPLTRFVSINKMTIPLLKVEKEQSPKVETKDSRALA